MSRILRMKVLRSGTLAAAGAALVLGASTLTSAPIPAYAPVAVVSTLPTSIGFSDHGGMLGMSQADLDAQLDAMVSLGSHSLRIAIPWSSVQPLQNVMNWTDVDRVVNTAYSKNISLLGIIAYTPGWAAASGGSGIAAAPASPAAFGTFAGQVAARYLGKVSAYEIWNEPNGSMFYNPAPNAAGYTNLLKAAYPAIKAADSAATVVGGVLGSTETIGGNINPVDFATSMYAAGAKGYFDALSFHPYQYSLAFSAGVNIPNSPVRQVMAMRALMVAQGDGAKKIWATEYGVPSPPVDEWQANTMITDLMIKWQEMPFTGPIYLYQFRDQQTGSSDPEMNFGITHTDNTPKVPAYGYAYVMGQGVPKSAEFTRFAAAPSAGLGDPVSPVFQISGIWAQMRANGTLWETQNGFLSSPPAVAERALPSGFVPTTAFANGYQDFNSPYGLRIWWSAATGAHLAGGGIVAAWTPALGLAKTDEVPLSGGGVKVTFQNGSITWTPGAGAQVGA